MFQGEYNLFKRNAEKELFPYATEQNISFIPYFPLASGLLTGKYNKDTVLNESLAKSPQFQGEVYLQNIEKVEQIRKIAEAKNAEVANVVLAWYLTRDAIDAIIPGAKRTEQILNNLKTLEVQLTGEEIQKIDRIFQ